MIEAAVASVDDCPIVALAVRYYHFRTALAPDPIAKALLFLLLALCIALGIARH